MPGITLGQRKIAAGLINENESDGDDTPEEGIYRGNIERMTFKSCGYVNISGVPHSDFNQNGLVMHHTNPRDEGMAMREYTLSQGKLMLKEADAQGRAYCGLGKLTQCIHPIDKRVLEEAWGMRFGWENDVERYAAVEDGCFAGGTGRFSGTIERETKKN
jgi:hypothetical protein